MVPLLITSQIQNQTVPVGTNTTFTLVVNSLVPVDYQWKFNGTNLFGATSNPLILTNIQPNQAGVYSAIVSNVFGLVTASNSTLVVIPLAIASQPESLLSFVGLTIGFNVVPVFQGPFSFQWRFNGTNIVGATDNSLVLTNLQVSQAGVYSGLVSNAFGSLQSADAALSVQQVAAWGDNTYGQTNVPSDVTNAIAVAGCLHSMALKADGRVEAWGYNASGQANVPSDLTNVIAIAAGYTHSLALKADGTVRTWGDYFDGLNYYPAVPPAGLTNVVAIAAGYYHALALKADGTVVAYHAVLVCEQARRRGDGCLESSVCQWTTGGCDNQRELHGFQTQRLACPNQHPRHTCYRLGMALAVPVSTRLPSRTRSRRVSGGKLHGLHGSRDLAGL